MDRDGYPDNSFWQHVRSWWAIRDLPNVRLVHYANLKRDLPGQMRKIAAFLDIPIDESRWDAILEHCSIEWMRANTFQGAERVFEGGANTFFYRGVNGRWSETLTPADIAEYEARAVHELGDDCAHWLATGENN
jgi:aryl sulfotransferase